MVFKGHQKDIFTSSTSLKFGLPILGHFGSFQTIPGHSRRFQTIPDHSKSSYRQFVVKNGFLMNFNLYFFFFELFLIISMYRVAKKKIIFLQDRLIIKKKKNSFKIMLRLTWLMTL